MQFALVDNIRREASPGLKGICDNCGSTMISKCGDRIVHHWAHHRIRNCDPWWENETEWHRKWKELFPERCREVLHVAENGEIHRADVKTENGIYIEFQHSSMNDEERLSREKFYKNLVWIVDGLPFINNFHIFHGLPCSRSEVAKDLVWYKSKKGMRGTESGMFWRISENPDLTSKMVLLDTKTDRKSLLESSYKGDHQYDWVRPRQTWLEATCPVYIDFGEEYLVKLENYPMANSSKINTIKIIPKKRFLEDITSKRFIHEIGDF